MTPFFLHSAWIKNYLPAFIWMVVSYVLLLLPGELLPNKQYLKDIYKLDKVLHFLLFFVMFVAIAYGSAKQYRVGVLSFTGLIGVLVTMFVAASSELVQEYCITNRYGSLVDFLTDLAGCCLAYLLFLVPQKKKIVKKQEFQL